MSTTPPDADALDELDLRSRLHAVEHLGTEPDRLLAAGLRAGRLRRRRHRLTTGALAAAAVAGVGVGALQLLPPDLNGVTSIVAAGPTVTPAAPPVEPPVEPRQQAQPAPEPGPGSAAATTRQLPARVAALYLVRSAPSGDFTAFEGQQSANELYVGARLDRGDGEVGLQVNVQGHFLGSPAGKAGAQEPVGDFYTCRRDTYLSCTVSVRADGSTLLQATQRIGRATVVHADLLRADGTRVAVRTGDTTDLKYGGEPRTGVSRTAAVAVATDPAWDLYATPSRGDVAAAARTVRPWTLLPS